MAYLYFFFRFLNSCTAFVLILWYKYGKYQNKKKIKKSLNWEWIYKNNKISQGLFLIIWFLAIINHIEYFDFVYFSAPNLEFGPLQNSGCPLHQRD